MTKTLLLCLLLATIAVAGERLTNADIIRLTQGKLSPDVIITAIKNAEPSFDTSTKALIELRAAGVANEVISAMLTSITGTSGPPSDLTVVRLEFPGAMYRVTRSQFYTGVVRVYDDRIAFDPDREKWQEHALTIPWKSVTSMCYEEGPIYGDLHLTLREHKPDDPALRFGVDPSKIIAMKNAIATFTKRPIPECE